MSSNKSSDFKVQRHGYGADLRDAAKKNSPIGVYKAHICNKPQRNEAGSKSTEAVE